MGVERIRATTFLSCQLCGRSAFMCGSVDPSSVVHPRASSRDYEVLCLVWMWI